MSEWNFDMSEAPKEGRFLVYGGTWVGDWSGEVAASDQITLIDRWSNAFSVADTEYYGPEIVSPVAWMPLPNPPEEGEEGRDG